MFIIFLLLSSLTSFSAEKISFSAQIKNETLSEEAILLLQCLADESGTEWELSPSQGNHWLQLKEVDQNLASGTYKNEINETKISLQSGSAEKICKEIYPKKATEFFEPKNINESDFPKQEIKESKTWVWASLGLAAVTGFFLWKSSQPDHRAFVMQ